MILNLWPNVWSKGSEGFEGFEGFEGSEGSEGSKGSEGSEGSKGKGVRVIAFLLPSYFRGRPTYCLLIFVGALLIAFLFSVDS